MKIAAAQSRPARTDRPPSQPPIGLTDMGIAALVVGAATSEEAWIALVDRLPTNGAYLAARLMESSDRVDQASAAVAKGLAAIGEKRRAGEPVPASWVDRLADLAVEEFDSLVSWDDAAHNAGHVPAWVEVPADQRPIPAEEKSWSRISRLYTRVLQQVAGLMDIDRAWDVLGGMDPARGADETDVEATKERGRDLVRRVVHEVHDAKETTPC